MSNTQSDGVDLVVAIDKRLALARNPTNDTIISVEIGNFAGNKKLQWFTLPWFQSQILLSLSKKGYDKKNSVIDWSSWAICGDFPRCSRRKGFSGKVLLELKIDLKFQFFLVVISTNWTCDHADKFIILAKLKTHENTSRAVNRDKFSPSNSY